MVRAIAGATVRTHPARLRIARSEPYHFKPATGLQVAAGHGSHSATSALPSGDADRGGPALGRAPCRSAGEMRH